MEPRVLRYQNYQLEITDCWVEEQTRTDHDFIFFERVTKLGNPRLVLNYRGQRLTPDVDSVASLTLVREDDGSGLYVGQSEDAPNPRVIIENQYTGEYDSNTDTVYFSLIRRWGDARQRQIRVYPKP